MTATKIKSRLRLMVDPIKQLSTVGLPNSNRNLLIAGPILTMALLHLSLLDAVIDVETLETGCRPLLPRTWVEIQELRCQHYLAPEEMGLALLEGLFRLDEKRLGSKASLH